MHQLMHTAFDNYIFLQWQTVRIVVNTIVDAIATESGDFFIFFLYLFGHCDKEIYTQFSSYFVK